MQFVWDLWLRILTSVHKPAKGIQAVCVCVCDIVLIAVCGTLKKKNLIILPCQSKTLLLVVLCLLYCSLNLCIIILRARHDHNKIAPCGMIKVFLTELNYKVSVLCSASAV